MAQQLENVKVNGKPAAQFISEQKSREIQAFLQAEMRGFRRSCSRPASGSKFSTSTSKMVSTGNGSIKAEIRSEEVR